MPTSPSILGFIVFQKYEFGHFGRFMQTYEIRRVRSGIDSGMGWVSLWFRGEGRALEPLHFACSREAQGGRYAKYDTLYLERDDQATACYGGAKRVTVSTAGIKVQLNPVGVKALGLPSVSMLTAPTEISGWIKARKVFAEMTKFPTKPAISVVELSKEGQLGTK